MINEKKVYELIKPYLKGNTLSYRAFFYVFSFLRQDDQYKIINVIEENLKIHVCDEEEQASSPADGKDNDISVDPEESIILPDISELDEDGDDDEDFESLYNKNAFINDNYVERTEMNLKQSNETLCRLIQEGDELAKEELCIKNKRLVYKYALSYSKYYKHKLDIQDLVQVGFIGLLKGAENFDFSKGYAFSTYVVWWIKQKISREIMDNGYTIRVPVHLFESINKLRRVEETLINDLKRNPTDEELAEVMNIEVSKVRELSNLKENILKLSSLDVPVGEEGETPLWELIEDSFVEPTEKLCDQIAIYEIFDNALRQLPPREEKVIRLRFGFDDGIHRTLEEVGQIMGVTRERIRQIEGKALKKLSFILKDQELHLFFEQ